MSSLRDFWGPFTETFLSEDQKTRVSVGNAKGEGWWAHLDSNQGPTGYEPVALTS